MDGLDLSSGEPALVGLGVLLALLGVGALVAFRLRPGLTVFVPCVGPISQATQVVAGMGLLIAGYHVLAHTLDWQGFRLPLWAVVIGVPVGVCLSMGVDALENRLPDTMDQTQDE